MKKLLAMALALVMCLGITTTVWADGEKGSEANPYSLEEFNALTREQYAAAQVANNGTLYVNVGEFTYSDAATFTLGNGTVNDNGSDKTEMNYYGANGYKSGENAAPENGKKVVFQNGTITSGAGGYSGFDSIPSEAYLLLAVPAYTNVEFNSITFNKVFNFGYQVYTSPWSSLGEVKFCNCTFNGLVVGRLAAEKWNFDTCTFNDYKNETGANNSNPIWLRPMNATQQQGELVLNKPTSEIVFNNCIVTSTRPVKFEDIGSWTETGTTVEATNNTFNMLPGDKYTEGSGNIEKNSAFMISLNKPQEQKCANVTISDNTLKTADGVHQQLFALLNGDMALTDNSKITFSNNKDGKGDLLSGTELAGAWKGSAAPEGSGEKVTALVNDTTKVSGNVPTTVTITDANGFTKQYANLQDAVDDAADGDNVNVIAAGAGNATFADNKTILISNTSGETVTVNGTSIENNGEQHVTKTQTAPRYYYNSTTTTTKDDTKTSSPKTFDAGVGVYAVSAILSVTGMACVGKKKF